MQTRIPLHLLASLSEMVYLRGTNFRVFSRILVIGDIREIKYPRNTRFFAFYLQFKPINP